VSSADGTLCLWRTATGELLQTMRGHRLPTIHLTFLGPQTLFSVNSDGTCSTWDLTTGRERRRVTVGPTYAVAPAVLSPDGKTLANGSRLHFWDISTGRPAEGVRMTGPGRGR
jgi:WD40 repeat protein